MCSNSNKKIFLKSKTVELKNENTNVSLLQFESSNNIVCCFFLGECEGLEVNLDIALDLNFFLFRQVYFI